MQTTELQSLGKLFDAYISDRKVFRCPSDNSVSEANNLGLSTTNTDFTTSRCSYGYDDNHTATNDPGTAIAKQISWELVQHFQLTTGRRGKMYYISMAM